MKAMFSRSVLAAVLLPLALSLASCESTLNIAGLAPEKTQAVAGQPIAPVASAPGATDSKAAAHLPDTAVSMDIQSALPDPDARSAQRLQAGDKVRIIVYGEDKLTGDYEVDPSGTIAMPLAGVVNARGLTKDELEKAVARKLREARILRNPIVTVNMTTSRPFYVLGEVERPGGYAYQNGLNVMSAVALAGGFTYRASKAKILIQRAGEKSFTQHTLSPDVTIQPGDLISVPERYF